jgi:tyrosinase
MRREVRDLKDNHPDQWNLYLLGLDALQQADQNDPLSYYGLARKCPLS